MELGHLPYKKATYEDYVGGPRVGPAWQDKKGGGSTFLTWLIDWSPRSNLTMLCSAAATLGY